MNLIDKQVYQLTLSAHYRIHNIFYVLYLELHKSCANNDTLSELPFLNLIDDEEEYEFEEILN